MSVVLPCSGDRERTTALARQFDAVLAAGSDSYELLIIVDTEIHGEFLNLVGELPALRVLDHLQPSGGGSTLVAAGLAAATGDAVAIYNPATSCNPAAVAPLVAFVAAGWDAAIGVRAVGRGAIRGQSGAARADRAFRSLVNQAIDPSFDGHRAGMIVLRRETVDAIVPHLRSDDCIFDIEVLAVARRMHLRRHAYHQVEYQGFATATPDSTLAASMRAAAALAVRLRCTPELRRHGAPDQRPRAARLEERRTHQLIGIALQQVALRTPTHVAVQALINAAHGDIGLLDMAAASCSHDDRRSGPGWRDAEPVLRRAANHLRFEDLASAAATV